MQGRCKRRPLGVVSGTNLMWGGGLRLDCLIIILGAFRHLYYSVLGFIIRLSDHCVFVNFSL